MRKLFETPANRQAQAYAALKLQGRLFCIFGECDVAVTSKTCKHDINWSTPELSGICEYKQRTHKFGTYPDVMITKSKWDYLRSYDGYAILLTEFTDGDYITEVQQMPDLESRLAGPRIKRNEFDQAQSVFIPLVYFIRLDLWKPNQTGQIYHPLLKVQNLPTDPADPLL